MSGQSVFELGGRQTARWTPTPTRDTQDYRIDLSAKDIRGGTHGNYSGGEP